MTTLVRNFRYIPAKQGSNTFNYKASRLRLRLQKDFPELVFHRPKFRRKSYIVYLKEYEAGDVLASENLTGSEGTTSESSSSDESEWGDNDARGSEELSLPCSILVAQCHQGIRIVHRKLAAHFR
ncbi:uncharacterized protein LOC130636308 [Hydractinia symbiolongicarpus]|uniref:uncharacterized protein LOC130636308 n=1 Tax=Hydractinia symbiolongicarpus TaxID=13093 RepID=UPI0025516D16|nr:uncharacterized protein LOC130636308 [Hydractinia symbiolongicarpus]